MDQGTEVTVSQEETTTCLFRERKLKQLDGFKTWYWCTLTEASTHPKRDTNRLSDLIINGAGIAGRVTAQGLITGEISSRDQP